MRQRVVVFIAMVAGILHVTSPSALAQTRPDTGQARIGHVAPIVDDSILKQSAHGKLVCVACHTGLDPKNVPYRDKIEPVICLRCHADAQFKHAFHPQLAQAIRSGKEPRISCKDCHGTHDIASAKVPGSKFHASRLSESCEKCHRNAVEIFRGSAHGNALAAEVKGAPTCLACHRSNITFAAGTADSLIVKAAQAHVCLRCHLDSPEVRERTSPTAGFVTRWDSSAHGTLLQQGDARAANCVSCHGSHDIRKTTEPGSLVSRHNIPSMCAKCHAETEKKFSQSVHGTARSNAATDSMTCATCHDEHAKPAPADAQSGVAAKSVTAQVCSHCHDPVALSGKYGIASDRFRDFSDSYHGLALKGGAVEAANCASCHGAHDVKPKNDTTSSVYKANRAVNCGRCHPRASERFSIGPVHRPTIARTKSTLNRVIPAGIILIAALAGGVFLYSRSRRRHA
jgi:hypothetical protein